MSKEDEKKARNQAWQLGFNLFTKALAELVRRGEVKESDAASDLIRALRERDLKNRKDD